MTIRRPTTSTVIVAVGLIAVGGGLLAWYRGSDDGGVRFPDVGSASSLNVAGVVAIDNGDGVLDDGDVPVRGATLRLGEGTQFYASDGASVVSDNGSFVLLAPPANGEVEMFVDAAIPVVSPTGRAGGSAVNVRLPVERGDLEVYLAVAHRPVPCGESPCGAPLLPDLTPVLDGVSVSPDQALPQDSWRLDGDTLPGQSLLRFSTIAANVGAGPLHVISDRVGGAEQPVTYQRLWTDQLAFTDVVAGRFGYHEAHDHIHVDNFEEYRLYDSSDTIVARHEKVSFCLVDSLRFDAVPAPEMGIHRAGPVCGGDEQVINSGWSDYYGSELPDQWIDVTGLPAGRYEVEIVVDPADLFEESDESNNAVRFPVTLG